jgi:hypothetical protein
MRGARRTCTVCKHSVQCRPKVAEICPGHAEGMDTRNGVTGQQLSQRWEQAVRPYAQAGGMPQEAKAQGNAWDMLTLRRCSGQAVGPVHEKAQGQDESGSWAHADLKALRSIHIRHHCTDEDPLTCLKRGYDKNSIPLCPHGYRLAFNGHDYQRRDSKWVCRQRCTCHPTPELVPEALADEKRATASSCPYRDPAHPLGFSVTVNLTLPLSPILPCADLLRPMLPFGLHHPSENWLDSRTGGPAHASTLHLADHGHGPPTDSVHKAWTYGGYPRLEPLDNPLILTYTLSRHSAFNCHMP